LTIVSPLNVGIYIINTSAEIPQENPLTPGFNRKTSSSFTLTVQSDCINTQILDKIIADMNLFVNLPASTQDVAFEDSIAASHVIPAYCGTRTYTLSPTYTFLSILGTTMSLYTANSADIGDYPVDLTVSLAEYPGITSITKSFIASISTCLV